MSPPVASSGIDFVGSNHQTQLSSIATLGAFLEIITMTKSANAGRKQKDTRFKPGQSGNPAGKRPGTRHRTTMAAQALLDNESETLTRKCIELALGGEMGALRLCLERIIPPSRERPIKISLPDTSSLESIDQAAEEILRGVATGQLLPTEGTVLSNLVEKRRAALETLDLEQRITQLEENNEKSDRKKN
jgi:hypothetical protein